MFSETFLLISSSREPGGVAICDLNTGSSISPELRNNVCDPGNLCIIGGDSSFSGRGFSADSVAASQSKKPVIHIWQLGKPQVSIY